MPTKEFVEACARVVHEVNRAYCAGIGDDSQKPWEEAEEWQRQSSRDGVLFAINNPDAPISAQHDAWVADKVRNGWQVGEEKNAEAKTHPCMVPFSMLPVSQQVKDELFRAVVRGVASHRIKEAYPEP